MDEALTKQVDFLKCAYPLPASPDSVCVCGWLIFNWEYSPDAFVNVLTPFLVCCKTSRQREADTMPTVWFKIMSAGTKMKKH